jgi:hypothetical protein
MNITYLLLSTDEEMDKNSDQMSRIERIINIVMAKGFFYPAVKKLSEKYLDWLAEKRHALTKAEFEVYQEQFEITLKICQVQS